MSALRILALSASIFFCGSVLAQAKPGKSPAPQQPPRPEQLAAQAKEQEAAAATTEGEATAETADKKDEKKDELKVQPGVVAGMGTISSKGGVFNALTPDAPGEEPGAITGGISVQKGRCVATLSNADKDNAFSVRYAVEGFDKSGKRSFRQTYSATIKPGASVSRTVGACDKSANVQVVVESGKKISSS
ncbi:hypothetical protein JNK13_04730 [bacterium]|nr:hypothetical protein [bacterium]